MSAAKRRLVVGFLFDSYHQDVVLIRKNRPAWQAGLWNGVGGKVEPGESIYQAMPREFEEETGLRVDGWIHFASLEDAEVVVEFFYATSRQIDEVESRTDEEVRVVRVDGVRHLPTIPNLPWLISMATTETQAVWPYRVLVASTVGN